jgi:cytochrome c oxidase cbb3-type subunit 3
MLSRKFLIAAALAVATLTSIVVRVAAQGPPARGGAGAPGPQGGGRGPTFPAQQRAPGDPALIARGKTLFGINCASCHGADARGGDQGGPNLLRSQVTLDDQHGELIIPIVQGSRQNAGMDPINIPNADVTAIAEFLHSLAGAGRGRGSAAPLNVLVGSASAGQVYFAAKCSTCHAVTGDLKNIGARIPDPLTLQNFWLSGGAGAGRGGGGGGGAAAPVGNVPPTTVTVTTAVGQETEGQLVRIDDFMVSLTQADGSSRTFRRNGDVPKVEIHDPLDGHRKLLPLYTDKDIHDVTAYLVTLK